MSVRTRFAPSPTGRVHIGNMRTAIFNWLYARHEGGRFLLRIEDTDRERSTPEAVQAVFDAMEWLGLDYDEEPLYQHERRREHMVAAETLLEKGLAYREDKGGTGKGECIVFRMPGTGMAFHDLVKGDLRKDADDMKDFVIVRSDGTPVFHLANVVDDIHMGVTHIIRGDDHVENAYRHVALYEALGAAAPQYAHLPMIINAGGKPYSKRDGGCFVGEFRNKGFSADALFNYLSLLGWSPGDDREKLSRSELVELFTLDRVKSSPAQVDIKKLIHLNGQYVAQLPLDEFVLQARRAISGLEWSDGIDENYFRRVCALMQTRTTTYSKAAEWIYFFSDAFEYDEKPVRKILNKEGRKEALTVLLGELADAAFDAAALENAIRAAEKQVGLAEGKLNQPIRVAVTGSGTGAGIYETMEVLGRERTVARLKYAIDNLCG